MSVKVCIGCVPSRACRMMRIGYESPEDVELLASNPSLIPSFLPSSLLKTVSEHVLGFRFNDVN